MPETNHHLLARRLKELRISNSFTQSEVAGKIGVHKTTIMRWENGGGTEHIKLPVIAALAGIFRVSPAYLMGWIEEPMPNHDEEMARMLETVYEPYREGQIGESEACSCLKFLLAYYGLPRQEYDDALLLKLLNSDLLRNLLSNSLNMLRQ